MNESTGERTLSFDLGVFEQGQSLSVSVGRRLRAAGLVSDEVDHRVHVGDHHAEHRHLLFHEGEALREEVHLSLCAAVLAAGDREPLGRADGALLAAPVVGSVVILLLALRPLLLLFSTNLCSSVRRSFAFRTSASALVSFLNVNVCFGIANLLRWVFSLM